MRPIKVKSWLPIFSGFYESMWSFNEEDVAQYFLNDHFVDHNKMVDIIIDNTDYDRYEEDIAKKLVNVVSDVYPFIIESKFIKLNRPEQYNFTTDSIDVEFEIDHDEFKILLFRNMSKFAKWIKKKYTSCDGFLSLYPTNVEGWAQKTDRFNKLDGHYLGAIMEFMWMESIVSKEMAFQDIYDKVFSDFDLLEYVDIENVKKQLSKLEEK